MKNELIHGDALTVTGKTVGQNIEGAEVYNDDVIRTEATALYHEGALAVLKGNLAPNGCVIKPSDTPYLRPSLAIRSRILRTAWPLAFSSLGT